MNESWRTEKRKKNPKMFINIEGSGLGCDKEESEDRWGIDRDDN